jgi:hypothetical protein
MSSNVEVYGKKFEDAKMYRLTRDVENPRPDKRSRRKWTKAAVWKAGTIFRTQPAWWTSGQFRDLQITTGYYAGDALILREASPTERDNGNLVPWELVDALEEIAPKNVRQALRCARLEGFAEEGFDVLIKQGRLTLDEVLLAVRLASALDEDR